MPFIESLTPEQEAAIPDYREKWRLLRLSTERMDRRRAESALKAAYTLAGKPDPEFQFLDGPRALQEFLEQYATQDFFRQRGNLVSLYDTNLLKRLQDQFAPELWKTLSVQLTVDGAHDSVHRIHSLTTRPLSERFNQSVGTAWADAQARQREELREQFQGEFLIQLGEYAQRLAQDGLQAFNETIWQPLSRQPFMQSTVQELDKWAQIGQAIKDTLWDAASQGGYAWLVSSCVWIDFCSSILEFSDTEVQHWLTLRSVVRSCGVVSSFENLCLVVERPTKILLDAERKLHGEDEPALTFADGSAFYFNHGDLTSS
ncbi:MAG: DUF6745 domain-containing protein [Cyanobacteria bacterium P01_D01_bin.44]